MREVIENSVEMVLQGSQQDFPVVANGAVAGILTRADLIKALAQQPPTTPVSVVMQREFPVVEAGEMLEALFARLQECQCHTVPVTRRGALVGLVTSDNIGEFLMIQAAMKGRATGVVPPVSAQTGV